MGSPLARGRLLTLLMALVSAVFCLVLGELGARLLLPAAAIVDDEKNLSYRYDPDLGWFPTEARAHDFFGHRRIHVKDNRDGFRDHEYGVKTRPRVLVLGDSFVWGYDAEQEERFTERLQALLPEREILNQGVSGYGTDQEYLLLQKSFARYAPEVVILVYCTYNDHDDNTTNVRNGYYKPYFTFDGEALSVHGQPVPKSINYYHLAWPFLFRSRLVQAIADLAGHPRLRHPVTVPDPSIPLIAAMKHEVEAAGARFVLALVDDDRRLEPQLRERGIGYLNFRTRRQALGKFGHWSRHGHEVVAQMLLGALSP